MQFFGSLIKQLSPLVLLMVGASSVYAMPILAPSWTGMYGDANKIAVFMQQSGNTVTGYSILNGKSIPFSGSISPNGKMLLNERGKGNAVGRFILQLSANNRIKGQWQANNPQVKSQSFTLQPQQCRYAKGQGDYPQASNKILKDDALQDHTVGELRMMRNEIYARHGYAFDRGQVAAFSDLNWYMPCYQNVESKLTDIERQNLKKIKIAEKYAADRGAWGR